MIISLIWAMGNQRGIGKENGLIWRLKGDLPRFKTVTMGSPVVMGRKTYESIGKPLPGRTNVIITRNKSYQIEGATVVHGVEEAIVACEAVDGDRSVDNELFVIGGAEIYALFLDKADKLYLTLVDDDAPADAFFPTLDLTYYHETGRETIDDHDPPFSYITYERIEA